MTEQRDIISTRGLQFEFNRHGGNITNLVIETEDGQSVRPLHAAPWTQTPSDLPDDVDLVERQLAGDFFCAPFGASEGGPIHGQTANGNWQPQPAAQGKADTVRYTLQQTVQGAKVEKSFTLVEGHPFLYQNHTFSGGQLDLPIAHHAMIHVPGGAQLSFSKKQFGITPTAPLETDPARGQCSLLYPQRFEDITKTALADGGISDASQYPFSQGHEDILILAEDKAATTGWSAALAEKDGFLFFAIKDARVLPETLLWMSNGGRYYPPWSGRHTAVLGIEEAATACHDRGDFGSSPKISQHGLKCGLTLQQDADKEIRYGFGAIPVPEGWSKIDDIDVESNRLTLMDISGESLTLPFLGSHFGL